MTRKRWLQIAAALIVVVIVAWGASRLLERVVSPPPEEPAAAAPVPPAANVPRIIATLYYGTSDGQALAAVKREVWKRDGSRCAFVGSAGQCTERGCLEFHHVIPFADDGPTTAENLQLRCRAHNAYEAEVHFGPLLLREERGVYQRVPDRADYGWKT